MQTITDEQRQVIKERGTALAQALMDAVQPADNLVIIGCAISQIMASVFGYAKEAGFPIGPVMTMLRNTVDAGYQAHKEEETTREPG